MLMPIVGVVTRIALFWLEILCYVCHLWPLCLVGLGQHELEHATYSELGEVPGRTRPVPAPAWTRQGFAFFYGIQPSHLWQWRWFCGCSHQVSWNSQCNGSTRFISIFDNIEWIKWNKNIVFSGLPWCGSSIHQTFSRASRCTLAPYVFSLDRWSLFSPRLFLLLGRGALPLQKNFLTPRQWSSMGSGLLVPPTWHFRGYITVRHIWESSKGIFMCCL